MAIQVHLALFLLLATVPLSAQTTAPSAAKAHAPTTDLKVVPKPTVFQADEVTVGCCLGTSRSFSRLIPSAPARKHWSSEQRRCPRETKSRQIRVDSLSMLPGHNACEPDMPVLDSSGLRANRELVERRLIGRQSPTFRFDLSGQSRETTIGNVRRVSRVALGCA